MDMQHAARSRPFLLQSSIPVSSLESTYYSEGRRVPHEPASGAVPVTVVIFLHVDVPNT